MKVNERRRVLKQILTLIGGGLIHHGAALARSPVPGARQSARCAQSIVGMGNPIIPHLGLCDPQIRVFQGHVYLYATHDESPNNRFYHMKDWWVWKSVDLVHWEQISTLKPEQTFLRRPFDECWATDATERNGRVYFYFSAGPEEIGVVVGKTPAGPWEDPLGKPLIPRGLTPTEARDPAILTDDDGAAYIVFGTWDYYIARLNADMVSLAESPRLIALDRKVGPYGEGKTDDKPFLHQREGRYYLSWGCFYAMASNPYGPYKYKGSIVTFEATAPEFRFKDLLLDRHGSFFELHGQWYFACNDYSQEGYSPFFRSSILSHVHYLENGEIAPVRIDRTGVGRYDASRGQIKAEDFFKIEGGTIREDATRNFQVWGLSNKSWLSYPNVINIPSNPLILIRLSSIRGVKGRLEVRLDPSSGRVIGSSALPDTRDWDSYEEVGIPIKVGKVPINIVFVFRGASGEIARMASWQIVDRNVNDL